ncbi:hypothetical protein ACJMK2_006982 [Sinanodonta woodiana]|uniref:Ig-like domain-containing protein n=1 Tax=Sinanodonta woodiana TaxID=1069815 RepID=A0ABD3VH11_SINWO
MLCFDCRQYFVLILTSILFASCNYVEGGPSVAVLGGEAYMRWTISTTTIGNRVVLGPTNTTIIVFVNGQTQPRFEAPNVSYTESPTISSITELSPPGVVGGNSMLNCTTVSSSIPANHNLAMLSERKRNGLNIALGSKYSVIGTTLAINNLIRADNGDRFTCVAYEDPRMKSNESGEFLLNVLYGPDNVQITPTADLTVQEEGPVNMTCSAECNPVCKTYRWQDGIENTLIGSKQSLVMPKVRREQAGFYICNVTNDVTFWSATAQKKLSVFFAPDMSVKVTPSIIEANSEVHIECSVHGEPSHYNVYDWIHKLGNITVRHIKGILVNQSTLEIRIPSITIADMGTYICLVDNDITGSNGGIVQSAESHVNIIGVPVAFVSDTAFIGETNMSATIRIPFISNPSITDLKFFKTWNNAPVANDKDTLFYHTEANISTIFYSTGIVLQGMEAVLVFRSLKESDFGQYTLVLYNNKGTATLIVNLKELAPPSPMEQFYFFKLVGQYMEFFFVPGFNGGHQQTFTIQFKPSGNLDESWKNTSINGLSEIDDRYRLPNGTFLVQVEKLQPGRYIFRMFSVNKKNIRVYSHEVPVYFEEEPHTDANTGLPIAGIAGGIGGGIVVIVVTGVVILLWRRHNHTNKAADGTACVPAAENYEALQAKKNEGSLYHELTDIKSSADTKNSFRRNGPENDKHQPTYINTKETVCVTQDQEQF